jgi:hypothetical protein
MGILGELPRKEMLAKLQGEVASWQAADSTTKAIPAPLYSSYSTRSSRKTTCTACVCHTNK